MSNAQTQSRRKPVTRAVQTPGAPADPATSPAQPDGFTARDGREMYRITAYDRMPPFLMTLASDSDLWMYVSSSGGVTAGRCDEEHCLFPYETEDRLHYAHGITGPITILRVRPPGRRTARLWEPFNHRCVEPPVQRNLYKTVLGESILFEEIHDGLKLTFTYEWTASEEFGFVRSATLRNNDAEASVHLELLDGLLNIMPPGVALRSQQSTSSLVDAYKRAELDPQTGLAIYSLSSIIHDRPEPAVYLKANVVWSHGLGDRCQILLSDAQVPRFREGGHATAEQAINGRRGAFLLNCFLTLQPGQSVEWDIVADVDRDHVSIERLRQTLQREPDIRRHVAANVHDSQQSLLKNIAECDACQCTNDRNSTAHHAANVLFNSMRGGMPVDQYRIDPADFARFIESRNHQPNDTDLARLKYEYLPLTFGRRHGDPSRPWNRFTIRVKNADQSRAIRYEGNWRDIFQNWEALAVSFPQFIENFIAKFVNASTVDGFNPYRVSSDGIDWETLDPESPWSNIGYWGDHQIVYLLKLLEASQRHHPGVLQDLLLRPIFAYANVPYRLRPYAQIVKDPRNTIVFDRELARTIDARVGQIGADGKLLLDSFDRVYHVNLCEKLLVPLLAKLGNLVLGGGIWMNTQRPEWNDANNALAGDGLSVVTLCYLRRYVQFLLDLLKPLFDRPVEISTEVGQWLERIGTTLLKYSDLLREPAISDRDRRRLLDDLGEAFTAYRERVYASGFSGKTSCRIAELLPVLRLALSYLDHSLRGNRRETDGLYHSYNLLKIHPDGNASVDRLYEMLEGQVAVLSSGCLSSEEAVEVLESLLVSRMYRADQQSLMLYPHRQLKSFLEQNQVPPQRVRAIPLLSALIEANDHSIVSVDTTGQHHFSGDFRHAADLRLALDRLATSPRWKDLVDSSRGAVVDLFEDVFHHRSFTGRSGAMYGYEGLGCVYWHMVAKLLLAVQECFWRADASDDTSPDTLDAIAKMYYRIRDGLGFNKSPQQFGAFPTDPYSHTPANGGARQPGMTGQVKEEILTRFGELGLLVEAGEIRFRPILLRRSEFLTQPTTWTYFAVNGAQQSIDLKESSLAFTYCQVPFIYARVDSGEFRVKVTFADGTTREFDQDRLEQKFSIPIFTKAGSVARVDVAIPSRLIRL